MKKRFNRFQEAIDTGGYPEFFDQGKLDKIEAGFDIEEIMPDFGPNAQRYLEYITSESYKKCVQRLALYLDVPIEEVGQRYGNMSSLMGVIMTAMSQAQQIESTRKEDLEAIALNCVLDLPEFEMIKDLYEKGEIQFDIVLGPADLSNAITDQDEQTPLVGEDDLAPSEEATLELGEEFEDVDSEEDLKRELAKYFSQGNAVSKLYLYHNVVNTLEEIDERLPKLYGVLASVIQISYYTVPEMPLSKGMAQAAAQGSAEVNRNERTIIARGTTFVYLVHEIVKGIWEFLRQEVGSLASKRAETLDDEIWQIISGPEMYKQFSSMFAQDELRYLPLAYKLLLQRDANTIKQVLAGGGRAQQIIQELIQDAKQMLADFEGPEDTYDDGYGDIDDDDDNTVGF